MDSLRQTLVQLAPLLVISFFICPVDAQNLLSARLPVSDIFPTNTFCGGAIPSGSIDWGDFDNDGDQDILFVGDGVFAIWVNNGACNFTKKTLDHKSAYSSYIFANQPANTAFFSVWAKFINLNNDNYLDIISWCYLQTPGHWFGVFQGTGGGNFSVVPQFSYPATVITTGVISGDQAVWSWSQSSFIANYLTDCDADGDIDLIFGADGLSTTPPRAFYVYKNSGRGSFDPMPILTTLGYDIPRIWALAVGDIDGDGIPDLAWTCAGNAVCNTRSYVIISLGKGDCTFGPIIAGPAINPGYSGSFTLSSVVGNLHAPALGDCDGDGDLDILVIAPLAAAATTFGGGLMVNRGNLNFQRGTVQSALEGLITAQFIDVNGDGKLDVYGAPNNATSYYSSLIFLNQGNCTFTSPPHYAARTSGAPAAFGAWGDCDKDGDLDLLELCGAYWGQPNGYQPNTGPMMIFRNNATAILQPSPSPSPKATRSSTSSSSSSSSTDTSQLQMTIADMNNDGELDIVLAASAGSSVNILLQSSMNFSKVPVPSN